MALICSGTAACVHWAPVQIGSTDPSLAAQQRTENRIESDNVQAFIVDHPELDAQTKKELRDGTITVHEALERLKNKEHH